MPVINESDCIAGVYIAQLRAFADERGRFIETFRKEWFPQRRWDIVQSNRADSTAGVLRGLHYHHHQVDYWYVVSGHIRAGLVDLRPYSPTYRQTQLVDMDAANNLGLFIPVGVAHGYLTLQATTLTYVVDNYYDGADEHGLAWNDPDVGLAWGITEPLISPRDAANARLRDVALANLPSPNQE
jgi:dTDP-4-dehydrorhamnose 3,5-epimerase